MSYSKLPASLKGAGTIGQFKRGLRLIRCTLWQHSPLSPLDSAGPDHKVLPLQGQTCVPELVKTVRKTTPGGRRGRLGGAPWTQADIQSLELVQLRAAVRASTYEDKLKDWGGSACRRGGTRSTWCRPTRLWWEWTWWTVTCGSRGPRAGGQPETMQWSTIWCPKGPTTSTEKTFLVWESWKNGTLCHQKWEKLRRWASLSACIGATHRQQWRPPLMDEDGEEDDGAAQPEHPLWGPRWINKDHLPSLPSKYTIAITRFFSVNVKLVGKWGMFLQLCGEK